MLYTIRSNKATAQLVYCAFTMKKYSAIIKEKISTLLLLINLKDWLYTYPAKINLI